MNALALIENSNMNQLIVGRTPQTDEEATLLLNAINQPDEKLAAHINETFNITNFFIQNVEVKNNNKRTDEEPDTVILPRVVILDQSGRSYGCASKGVYNSLEKICALYGKPDMWTAPMTCKLMQVPTKAGSMLSLRLESANGNKPTF